jgi:hypothetical protein
MGAERRAPNPFGDIHSAMDITENDVSEYAPHGDAERAQGITARKGYMDPLVYLREFASHKKKVVYEDEWLDFEGHQIHRSTKCGFVLQGGGPLIDIGSVWYMLRETSADRSYNPGTTQGKGFVYIGVGVRGDLCDFLLGRSDTCPGLVADVIEGRKRPRDRGPKPPSKRPKIGPDGLEKSEITYEEAMRRVRPIQDLDVIIRKPGRTVPNAELILKIAQEEWQNWTQGPTRGAIVNQKQRGDTSLKIELEKLLEIDPSANPIILVPLNKTAPVNMSNVFALLQDGKYVKPDGAHLRYFESTREEYVEVTRNISGKMWTFEVRDSAAKFTKTQWLRTVLVISDGNEWQFKGWPFESVVDLFTTIRGVYFHDTGKPLAKHVAQWPCMKLKLPVLTAQHRFAQLRDEIFTDMEDFMNSSRNKKFVNTSGMEGLRTQPDFVKSIL